MDKIFTELLLVILATLGGIARYLNGFTNGEPFRLSIFIASAIVAGFAGYIFAIFGVSMGLPDPMLFVMAGTGGFFGEQTMKFVMDSLTNRK